MIIFFIIISTQNAYATNSTYEEKIQINANLEHITSYLISIWYNTLDEEYKLAQVQTMNLISEYDKILDTINSKECNKLEYSLNMLQYVSPKENIEGTKKIFSHIFEKLNNCRYDVIEKALSSNLYYNTNLITIILEKSQDKYVESDSLVGDDKIVKIQESLSLAIRAHMLVTPNIFKDTIMIEKNFTELFDMYYEKTTSDKIITLSNKIIDNLNDNIVNDGLGGFGVMLKSQQISIKPNIVLESVEYSGEHKLIKLHGENFEKKEKIQIQYTSPYTEGLQKTTVISNATGNFEVPLEFIHKNSDEFYFFSIHTGKTVSYELLAILDHDILKAE